MTIEELDEILALLDWDAICAEIEARGFRRAGEVGEWEFPPAILHEESAYRQSALQVDKVADKEYYGTILRDNRIYKGLTFITLTLFVIRYDGNPVSVPTRSLLFVDER